MHLEPEPIGARGAGLGTDRANPPLPEYAFEGNGDPSIRFKKVFFVGRATQVQSASISASPW